MAAQRTSTAYIEANGATVSGLITLNDQPFAGVTVQFRRGNDTEGEPHEAQTDGDGRYSLSVGQAGAVRHDPSQRRCPRRGAAQKADPAARRQYRRLGAVGRDHCHPTAELGLPHNYLSHPRLSSLVRSRPGDFPASLDHRERDGVPDSGSRRAVCDVLHLGATAGWAGVTRRRGDHRQGPAGRDRGRGTRPESIRLWSCATRQGARSAAHAWAPSDSRSKSNAGAFPWRRCRSGPRSP